MKLISKGICYYRKNGLVIPSGSLDIYGEISEEGVYLIQQEVISELGLAIGGWKLGGTGIASDMERQVISWGPLCQERVIFNSAIISDQLLLGAEVELAVKLSDVFSSEDLCIGSEGSLRRAISEVAVAIELPCSVFTLGSVPKNYIVADLCASGYAVLSESVVYEEFNSLGFQFELFVDDELQCAGDLSSLFDSVDEIINQFVSDSASFDGVKLDVGQWVVLGALCPLVEVKGGQVLRLESTTFNSIAVSIV